MQKRWKEIDALYTIGIILVVIGHSHSSDWNTFQGTVLHKAILFIYTFHMPLFFFISGFLFQNSESLEDRGYGAWVKDKALRLLTPYLFWSLLAAIPKYYLENRSLAGVWKAVLDVFISPRTSVWGHFWFLPVLFLTYIIFGAVRSTIKTDKARTLELLMIVNTIIYFLPISTSIFGLSDLHKSLLFFTVGMSANLYLSKTSPNIQGGVSILWIIVLTIGCVFLTPQAYTHSVVGLIVALLMISVCWIIAGMIEVKGWISSRNFTIYIFSWFFQAGTMVICEKLVFNWIYTFIFMFAAGFIGPVIIIALYEKFPWLHKHGVKLVLGIRR